MGCCSLKNFSLVLGFTQIILYAIITILCVVYICSHDKEHVSHGAHDTKESNSTTVAPFNMVAVPGKTLESEIGAPTTPIPVLEDLPYTLEALLTHLVLTVIALISTILLVIGIIKERPGIMRPYVYLNILGIVFMIVFTVVGFILNLSEGLSAGDVALDTLMDVVYTGVTVLLFSPIYIVYKRLGSNDDQSEQLGLRNNAGVPKPSYVHGDDV